MQLLPKKLNKFIIASFLLLVLIAPIQAQEDTIPVAREVSSGNGQMELIQNEINVKDLDIDPLNTKNIKNSVVPDTKKEGKKVMLLFLKTMLAVAFATVILYVILLFVKRFYRSAFVAQDQDEYENLDMSSPNSKQEALKSFLNRAKN